MQTKDFDYVLPPELIAQQPTPLRGASRLLVLDPCENSDIQDRKFSAILDFIQPDDCVVMNNTRVIPARLFGHKDTGGKVELLIERLLGDTSALCHVRSNKSPKLGTRVEFADAIYAIVKARYESLFELEFYNENQQLTVLGILNQHGHIPLPPYIHREDTDVDHERYQTVYAEEQGAIAAPTAGLHFTQELLGQIQQKANILYVTLHVGAGTFQPVRVADVAQHHMHKEWLTVSDEVVQQIEATRNKGGKVIAIGTTVVRALETAARDGKLQAYRGDTDIFITPGYHFNVVDALLTNFHLPESTLLMLVSALAGYENIRQTYQHAITQRYRFFSYGDAMFIARRADQCADK